MRWLFVLAMSGCLERVTGEVVPLDSRFTVQASSTASMGADDTGAPAHEDHAHVEVEHKEEAPPQPFEGEEGERVAISGTVVSEIEGAVDLDVSVIDPTAEGGMVSSGKLILDGPGSFSLEAPVGIGALHLAAFQDIESDGPSENDPYAEAKITIEDEPLSGLELVLVAGARAASKGGPTHTAVPPPQPFEGVEGDWVSLSGTIISDRTGAIDLDVGRKDATKEGGFSNEGKMMIAETGAFSVNVPSGIGVLRLAAFQDVEKNGPTQDDPYAELEVEVGSADIVGITFNLVEGARSDSPSGGPEHVEAPPGFGSGRAPPPDGSPTQVDPFAGMEGERVIVSGLLVWDGEQVIDLDLFTPDTSAGGGRKLLGKLKKKVGTFTLNVPVSLEFLELDAFVDLTSDGPSGDDPRATVRNISLTEGPVMGIQVLLATMVENAPPVVPEGGGTDIEEEFARTVGSDAAKKQTGDGR